MRLDNRLIFITISLFCAIQITSAQINVDDLAGADPDALNPIQTTLPFLTIAPDSRAGAMGDIGAATAPDINSQHWNAAKYAFAPGEGGIALSYTPWLKNLVTDINLAYLAGFYRIDTRQVLSGSLRYFSLGDIVFRNEFGDYQGQRTPNEFAIDAGYSRLFSDNFSGALTFRFIRSDITGGGVTSNTTYNAGISFAADISAYYQKAIEIDNKDSEMAFGLNISNMGNKISYTEDQDKQFIPINFRLGGRLSIDLDEYNSMIFAADINKFLVPTGYNPDVSVPLGIVRSFYDAPAGFKEELHEIMFSIGVEYLYQKQFAVRAGYFNEHQTKGNRKYFTAGIGLRLNVFSLDFAYLIPTSGRQNPLANTMRFTLGFSFDNFSDFR